MKMPSLNLETRKLIHATKDFSVVVLTDEEMEFFASLKGDFCPYGVVNMRHGTMEATVSAEFAAISVMEQMQELLNDMLPNGANITAIN